MLWDPQLFLAITLGFGRFTFAQAKALDFAWDLVVGSGGQALAITLVYPLFRRMLLAHMEGRPVSIQAYTSIAFEGITMASFWTILRNSLPHSASHSPRSARQRRIIFFAWRTIRNLFFWLGALCVFAYLLVFGIVLSLMTGYQAIAGAVVTPEGSTNLINATDVILGLDWFSVLDGSRVGLQDRYIVKDDDPNYEVFYDYALTYDDLSAWRQSRPTNDTVECHTYSSPSGYMPTSNKCVFFAPPLGGLGAVWSNITLNLTGSLQTTTLSVPLNVTGTEFGSSSVDYLTSVGVDQVAIPLSHLYANTKCLPTADYKWGFSSLLLFTFCLASILFLVVLQSMAWLVYNHSRSDRLQHPINVYQDAFDIVQELKDHYGGNVDPAVIRERVRKEGASMSLDLDGLPESRHSERQRSGRRSGKARNALSRFRRRKDKGLIVATPTDATRRDRFEDSLNAEETVALRPIFNGQTSSMTEVAAGRPNSEVHTIDNDAQRVQPSEQPAAVPYTHLNIYEGT
ncbi:hypothetical protein LTR56_005942 [Elasticomyces elasticus]|nr:hypothetical protein LTR56_005942 [Elasticomyces elasticus]KAK5759516.1 hypothetical protein LTS12_010374 [Elasticomyces elasticus]